MNKKKTIKPRIKICKLAKARNKFFEENPKLLEGSASGQYLKNRLEVAFISGWNYAEVSNAQS
ncbi:MAG TPA: hypothetical protein DCP47_06375 [Phycisphaerales bacterium]|nr:hypothetical protein [Phycisphaerales bacterium]